MSEKTKPLNFKIAAAMAAGVFKGLARARPDLPLPDARHDSQAVAAMREFALTGEIATLARCDAEVLACVLHRLHIFIVSAAEAPDEIIASPPLDASTADVLGEIFCWIAARPGPTSPAH
jgi:hypothetical protein